MQVVHGIDVASSKAWGLFRQLDASTSVKHALCSLKHQGGCHAEEQNPSQECIGPAPWAHRTTNIMLWYIWIILVIPPFHSGLASLYWGT